MIIGLGTLLGLDERPGEVAGWGVVPASVARAIVAAQRRCEWRFGVHDDDGWLRFDGITRRRPPVTGTPEQAPSPVDGVVEILLPARWLTHAFVPPDTGWTGVLADIAGQFSAERAIEQDPRARFPGRPLRRRTEMTYRWCLFPGCRRPARNCPIDHRLDWARGGQTSESNLGPACDHDHDNKSEWGWRLLRTGPRTFRWISPYRRHHDVTVPRVVQPAPRRITRVDLPSLEPVDAVGERLDVPMFDGAARGPVRADQELDPAQDQDQGTAPRRPDPADDPAPF
ncbi:MAG: HNH endonuclease signature motif containing protein [Jatrophihabitans sp.]|uniref:HNH endonuclease signature motif containing protein n=1 Tax=Jatrophihabitans sp. TaxID=1932789 RepID=UPI003F81F938